MKDIHFRRWLLDYNPDALVYPDRDEAVLGVVKNWAADCKHVAVYSWDRLFKAELEAAAKDSPDIDLEELHTMVLEHMDFNVTGGYVGPNTPLVLEQWVPDSDSP